MRKPRSLAWALDSHVDGRGGKRLSIFVWQVREGVGRVWPLALISVAILAASATWIRRRDTGADLRVWREAAIALVLPLLLPLWAALASGVEKNGRAPVPWATIVLGLLAAVAMSAALRVLYRGRARWYVFLPLAVTVVVACLAGLFVGGMQIVDDWV